ncbi:MAG: redox-regulated ATPase YchF [Candidatus Latescibacteria bacterium]|nr:redox-regulated ATPase YchF [Candidatus Latescibacterota bacterium]
MKIAIAGLSNSGKTTIFNALTGLTLETTVYPSTSGEPHYGVVKVPDERLDRLSEIFKPKKTTYSTVEYIDYLGLTKGDPKQNRSVLEFLKDADAVLHIVRAFKDESVMHPLGDIDPERDVSTLRTELILGDLELVEKRIESMELSAKKGKKPVEAERAALLKCREALENETPLRDIDFSAEDDAAMRHLQFMTLKPEILVLNIAEGDIGSDDVTKLVERLGEFGPVVALSGKVEMEISELPDGDLGASGWGEDGFP